MKNYFCTELGFEGKIPNNHTNLRALETWIKYLNATHLNIFKTLSNSDQYGGICWLVIPKGDEAVGFLIKHYPNVILNLKNKFEKIYCIQEGETTYWSNKLVSTQVWIYNQFALSDRIYTQNEYDKKFLKGLFYNIPIHIIRSVLDESVLEKNNFLPKSNKAIIPGPCMFEYLGFSNNVIFQTLEIDVDVPPMGSSRMPKDSYNMENNININYLQYKGWKEWMENLSQYRYGMFMVGHIGAATFPLNCGYFGIPCVGDNRADTQKLIYPDLSVDYLDYHSSLSILKKLKEDPIFYSEISKKSIELYNFHFNKTTFLEKLEL